MWRHLDSEIGLLIAHHCRVFPSFWSVETSVLFVLIVEPVLTRLIEQVERAGARMREVRTESFRVRDSNAVRQIVVRIQICVRRRITAPKRWSLRQTAVLAASFLQSINRKKKFLR